jgi:uncharacterized protein (DUF1499 family)
VQGALQVSHQALQALPVASRWGEVVGDHSGVAEIQQQGSLLRGEAKQVLVVVVDDLHQACKQHLSVVGRRRALWMGKSAIGQVVAPSGP